MGQSVSVGSTFAVSVTDVTVYDVQNLPKHNWFHAKPSAFVDISVSGKTICKSTISHNSEKFTWTKSFSGGIIVDKDPEHMPPLIIALVDHHNLHPNVNLGTFAIPFEDLRMENSVMGAQALGPSGQNICKFDINFTLKPFTCTRCGVPIKGSLDACLKCGNIMTTFEAEAVDQKMRIVRQPKASLEDFNKDGGKLGEGSFGSVYRAIRRRDGLDCCIKEVNFGEADDDNPNMPTVEEALMEVRAMQTVDSPFVIKYHDSFIEQQAHEGGFVLFIVMEFAPNGSLSQVLTKAAKKKLPIPEREIMRYFVHAGLGLRDMHSQKLLHRDIKSENMFFGKDGTLKLGDLGFSVRVKSNCARATEVLGTQGYIAPEVELNQPYGAKCDVWSLGCVLWELAALTPFPSEFTDRAVRGDAKYVRSVLRDQPKWDKRDYSTDLRALIEKCLTIDAWERPSMFELLELPYVAEFVPEHARVDRHAYSNSYYSDDDPDITSSEKEAALLLQGAARHILSRESSKAKDMSPVLGVLHKLFDIFDSDRDGTLSMLEFEMLSKYLREGPKIPQVVIDLTSQGVFTKQACKPLFVWYAKGAMSNYNTKDTSAVSIAGELEQSFKSIASAHLTLQVTVERAAVNDWGAHNRIQRNPNLIVTVRLNDTEVFKTKTVKAVVEASWNTACTVRPASYNDTITVTLWDQHTMHSNKEIGKHSVMVSHLTARTTAFPTDFAGPSGGTNMLDFVVTMQ